MLLRKKSAYLKYPSSAEVDDDSEDQQSPGESRPARGVDSPADHEVECDRSEQQRDVVKVPVAVEEQRGQGQPGSRQADTYPSQQEVPQ